MKVVFTNTVQLVCCAKFGSTTDLFYNKAVVVQKGVGPAKKDVLESEEN